MTSNELQNIIFKEINNKWETSNTHGIDLRKCLVTPTKQKYFSFDKTQTLELWTVLEETSDGNGYKIYFDEKVGGFGLGTKSDKDELICLGIYGTFLETLESM